VEGGERRGRRDGREGKGRKNERSRGYSPQIWNSVLALLLNLLVAEQCYLAVCTS
jgi:hypothetical protein